MEKMRQIYAQYESAPDYEAVKAAVKDILDKDFDKNNTKETYRKCFSMIDLTSLNSTDTDDKIGGMMEKVNEFKENFPDMPNVAAVCVYPALVPTAKATLEAEGVKIASVAACFPSSQTFIEAKIAEVGLTVHEGADEIDVVLNLGYFMEENYEELCDELAEIKESCREARLKVILETGALATAENIRRASILALYSGADFIKTSTGKGYPGASPEAAYVMCNVLKQYYELTGERRGVKVSGGIRTAEDAVNYYTIVRAVLGEEWLTKDLFRIGASSLVGDIERRLGK